MFEEFEKAVKEENEGMLIKESMDEICEALEGEILKSNATQEEK